jgi:hypothetical protein
LEIALVKRTYVLPWHQFLYAEGGDDEVRAVFAMHVVIVKGGGLRALLADLAEQTVTVIREPTRADGFEGRADQFIRDVVVQQVAAA